MLAYQIMYFFLHVPLKDNTYVPAMFPSEAGVGDDFGASMLAQLSDDDNPSGGGAAPVDVFEVLVAINDHITERIVMSS